MSHVITLFDRIRLINNMMEGMGEYNRGNDSVPRERWYAWFLSSDTGLHEGNVRIFPFLVLHFTSLNMLDVNVLHGFIAPKEAITPDTISVLPFSE